MEFMRESSSLETHIYINIYRTISHVYLEWGASSIKSISSCPLFFLVVVVALRDASAWSKRYVSVGSDSVVQTARGASLYHLEAKAKKNPDACLSE